MATQVRPVWSCGDPVSSISESCKENKLPCFSLLFCLCTGYGLGAIDEEEDTKAAEEAAAEEARLAADAEVRGVVLHQLRRRRAPLAFPPIVSRNWRLST